MSFSQALLAAGYSQGNYEQARQVVFRLLQFVAGSQPMNALAFVLDGLYYGVSDFEYAAYSMLRVDPAFGHDEKVHLHNHHCLMMYGSVASTSGNVL
ncbi:hypothetical protein CISIN_1g036574mg [Citrus sinensis]|uniref:Uncharacterized protein n=1 Tax=Citrus sinensis TaxID=2711 RepID=A0A067FJA8_CITSI|nr:hypothetical protein CISIN_1g036574mg [Citrus sinensis]